MQNAMVAREKKSLPNPTNPGEARILVLKLRWMGLEAEAEQLTRELGRFASGITLVGSSDTD